jgi:hypothetical protein
MVSPLGTSYKTSWENLINGESGIKNFKKDPKY